MPTSDPAAYSDWPPDILFDIVYGSAILHNFGTQTLQDGSAGWRSRFYPEEETYEASQQGQAGKRKRKHEQDCERADRAPKRLARRADSADDRFDNLMFLPHISMQPERVKAFWKEAEEKRQEKERSQLEKVLNWAKGVMNTMGACDGTDSAYVLFPGLTLAMFTTQNRSSRDCTQNDLRHGWALKSRTKLHKGVPQRHR